VTTVGFGDIVPVHPAAKIFVCCYIVCGIFALGYVLSSAVEAMLTVQAQSFVHHVAPTAPNEAAGALGWRVQHRRAY
jgi:hypothetical protein